VFEKILANEMFALIVVGTVVGQVLMVEVFGPFAQTQGLSWQDWLGSIGIGVFSLVWGLVVRCIPVNYESGRIDIPADTFAGAHLDLPDDQARGRLQLEQVRVVPVAARGSNQQQDEKVPSQQSPLLADQGNNSSNSVQVEARPDSVLVHS